MTLGVMQSITKPVNLNELAAKGFVPSLKGIFKVSENKLKESTLSSTNPSENPNNEAD